MYAPRLRNNRGNAGDQNAWNNPLSLVQANRPAGYKTEMCRNVVAGRCCNYGRNCNYAHSHGELNRYKSPQEMEEVSVIDIAENYIRLPCFDYTSTGCCPKEGRCCSLHDPRVASSSSAWLKYVTKPVKQSSCDIPDFLSFHRNASMFQTTPLIAADVWNRFGDDENRRFVPAPEPVIGEIYRIAIAYHMQANIKPNDRDFLYSNQHNLNTKACLVLQTKYYRLRNLQTGAPISMDDVVQEVPLHEYDCNHSIWFNVKTTKWIGKFKSKDSEAKAHRGKFLFCMQKNELFECMLPANDPIMLMQAKNESEEGRDLIQSFWKHRVGFLLDSCGISCTWNIHNHKIALKATFYRLLESTKRDAWPTLHDEEVSMIFQEKCREEHNSNWYQPHLNNAEAASIWNSFIGDLAGGGSRETTRPRLEVFASMTSKRDTALSKELPHITNSSTKFISRNSQDTWEELLLGKDGPWTRAVNSRFKVGSC
eukprot:scaffold116131_cov76-Cyclotella_meneghiniana.AAC.1